MPADTPRPNFFLILGLDPHAPWDERSYTSALTRKKQEWSRRSAGVKTHPATVEARRNLAFVPAIERVMRNRQDREDERRKAVTALAEDQRERSADLARRVELMLAKRYLYESEYAELQPDLAAADDAVRQRIESARRRPDARAGAGDERLDPTTEANLRDHLSTVGKADLYDVLREVASDVGPLSSRTDLLAAADEFYRRTRHRGNLNTPEVTARQQLAGIALTVFRTEDRRRQYESSRKHAPLRVLLERYQRDLATARRIDASQFEMYLRDAARLGTGVEPARESFIAHFQDLGWPVEVLVTGAAGKLRTPVPCPQCGELNEPDGKHCGFCGNSLTGDCPRCGLALSAGAGACPQCGLRVSMRGYAEYLAEEAETLLEHGDVADADDHLRKAIREWPLGPDSSDQLAIRLRELEDRLGPVRDQQRRILRQIDQLLETHAYRTARRQLRELSYSTPATVEMLQRCDDAIRESERKVSQACGSGVSAERKAALYLEALDYCADNSEASRELTRLPPGPPSGLRAEADEERRVVRLNWVLAPDEGCSSVIIRTDSPVPPAVTRANRRHTEQSGGTWEDREPLAGQLTWYAVYTERKINGIFSERPSVTAEPVLLTAAPGLEARPGDREVELTWTIPENASRVEIRREDMAAGTSVTLSLPERDAVRMVDPGVRNGARYRYAARAVYRYEPPGQPPGERRSRETTCDVVPSAAPPSPGTVHVRGRTPLTPICLQTVMLRWTPPEQGEVRIVRSLPGRPVPEPGKEFPETELGQYGYVTRESAFAWMKERERVCYFTPVLVLGGRCHAGSPRPYARGPEVGDVRAEHAGDSVRVTWTWPDGVDEALVAWGDHEIGDPVAASRKLTIRRSGSATGARHDIPVAGTRQLFVQVAAVVRDDNGAAYFTSGVGETARRPVVHLAYEIQSRGSRRGRLIMRPDQPAYLPTLVLRGRNDDRAAGRADTEILRIPAHHAKPGAVAAFRLAPAITPRSCRLFTEDETEADLVVIVHPR